MATVAAAAVAAIAGLAAGAAQAQQGKEVKLGYALAVNSHYGAAAQAWA
ncbi:C4-dicarboxylate ABC transporter substrate-binding protein, partial [Corallococcus exiguus]|nr:C4-dicarboxylate ABC transporter substrate-binding protein [Corallococcus exiguus]